MDNKTEVNEGSGALHCSTVISPKSNSFEDVNHYVHCDDAEYEDLQNLCLSLASCLDDADSIRRNRKTWRHSTGMDNGGRCVVEIDLVDGKCSCPEEAQEIVDWFELILRRFKKQASQ